MIVLASRTNLQTNLTLILKMGNKIFDQPSIEVNFTKQFNYKKEELFAASSTAGKKPVKRKKKQNAGLIGEFILNRDEIKYENVFKGEQQVLPNVNAILGKDSVGNNILNFQSMDHPDPKQSHNVLNLNQIKANGSQKIIAMTEKMKVQKPELYPHCSIGYLSFEFQNSNSCGTACLIGPNIALTCAHNLYSREFKKQAKNIFFVPGLNGKEGKGFKIVKTIYPPKFKSEEDQSSILYDYGIIKLDTPDDLGLDYGYFGINTNFAEEIKVEKKQVNLYGYTALKNEKHLKFQYGSKGYLNGQNFIANNFLLSHQLATKSGISGSPIFTESKEKGPQIVGIHIQGSEEENMAVALNETVRARINEWIQIMKGIFNISKLQDQQDDKNIGDGGITDLVKNIRTKIGFDKVTELHLANNRLGIEGIIALAADQWVALRILNLENNNLKTEGAKILGSKSWKALQHFNLNNTLIRAQGLIYILENGLNAIVHLYLNSCDLGAAGIAALVDDKNQWELLETLHLAKNKIDAKAVKLLTSNYAKKQELRFPALKDLNLSENSIGNEGISIIAQADVFPHIQVLYLNKIEMDRYGMEMLCKKQWKGLKYLRVDWNKTISSEGIEHLNSTNFKEIAYLNLDWLTLGRYGIKAIMQNKYQNLKSISLNYNYIGDEGLRFFEENKMPNLEALNLQGNNITKDGIKDFVAKGNQDCPWKNLMQIKLRNNKVDYQGFLSIISKFAKINYIDLHNNGLSANQKKQLKKDSDAMPNKIHLEMDLGEEAQQA